MAKPAGKEFYMSVFQPYPTTRYHYDGTVITVNSPEEEAALEGGWGKSPGEWDPYRRPRQAATAHDPCKWVTKELLPEGHKKKIEAQLQRAHASFWDSPAAPDAATKAMRRAFDGIAQILFDTGILTELLLTKEIPQLVWDSAIAGGWWRFASETRQDMFREQLGHYWVWRDHSRDWNALFQVEVARWRAIAGSFGPRSETSEGKQETHRRGRRRASFIGTRSRPKI